MGHDARRGASGLGDHFQLIRTLYERLWQEEVVINCRFNINGVESMNIIVVNKHHVVSSHKEIYKPRASDKFVSKLPLATTTSPSSPNPLEYHQQWLEARLSLRRNLRRRRPRLRPRQLVRRRRALVPRFVVCCLVSRQRFQADVSIS